jgi:hypothetical protein
MRCFKFLTALALLGSTCGSASAANAPAPSSSVPMARINRLLDLAHGLCPNSESLMPGDFYAMGRQGGWSQNEMDVLMGYCAMYLRGKAQGLHESADRFMETGRP